MIEGPTVNIESTMGIIHKALKPLVALVGTSEHYKGLILPGGRVSRADNAHDAVHRADVCLLRELREKCGITPDYNSFADIGELNVPKRRYMRFDTISSLYFRESLPPETTADSLITAYYGMPVHLYRMEFHDFADGMPPRADEFQNKHFVDLSKTPLTDFAEKDRMAVIAYLDMLACNQTHIPAVTGAYKKLAEIACQRSTSESEQAPLRAQRLEAAQFVVNAL